MINSLSRKQIMHAIFNTPLGALPDKVVSYAIKHLTLEWTTAIYNIFETSVVRQTCTDPQHANHIHVFKQIFNLGSVVWLYWNVKQVTNNLTNLGTQESAWFSKKIVYALTGSLVVGFVAITSYIGASLLFQCYKSEKLDGDLVAQMNNIPKNDQSNISVCWHRPVSRFYSQWFYCSRIVLNTFLACVTPHRIQYGICALAQAHSILKLSKLKWLQFSRTVDIEKREKMSEGAFSTTTQSSINSYSFNWSKDRDTPSDSDTESSTSRISDEDRFEEIFDSDPNEPKSSIQEN